ncbi:hypothetical protein ACFCYC_26090 [Streptomyces sp. NPDC056402]|uniref:hypothetical protein n=1 Tax=Streptomyces sp. NPDC056402 TaxID=3345810 RepID=UPI0035DF47FC
MGELKPIDDGLSPETGALAEALRALFAGLRISTRRYAARRAYDSATVSRYLSGRRLPPWDFVRNLLHDVAEERGTVPTEETLGMLRSLHSAALQAGGSPGHRVQLLERRLADADRESRRAMARERWLEGTLQDCEDRLRDLQLRYRELEAGPMQAPDPAVGAADEYAELREEIHELNAELARVRELHRQAEQRCERLERQLAHAEGRVVQLGPGDGWEVDEDFVASISVRLWDASGERHLGNGLLLDGDTVIATSLVESEEAAKPGDTFMVDAGARRVMAGLAAARPVPGLGEHQKFRPLAALSLAEPVLFPARPLVLAGRLPTGTRLVVSAHTELGRFSCRLEVAGRTGDWLRVSGEVEPGLGGAPAFTGEGAFAGLIGARTRNGGGGLLLPVEVLVSMGVIGQAP